MSTVRFSSALALGAILSVSASLAVAAPGPSIASLPEPTLPSMLHPKDAPEDVAASEHVEGVHIEREQFGGAMAFVQVRSEDRRCITLGGTSGLPASGSDSASFRSTPGASVVPLRTERLIVKSSGEAALELIDAWADMRSFGARVVSTNRVALTPIGKGPAGFTVYGFRSGDTVQVVVPVQTFVAHVDAAGMMGRTGCDHVRLALDAAPRSGSMILAAGMIEVPQAHKDQLRSTVTLANEIPQQAMPMQPQEMAPEKLWRAVQVSVSTSRTARDREALLSVVVGWAEEDPSPAAVGPSGGPAFPQPQVELD
jgi:hypothetical protein